MVSFQLVSEGLQSRRTDGVSPRLRAESQLVSSSTWVEREKIQFPLPFSSAESLSGLDAAHVHSRPLYPVHQPTRSCLLETPSQAPPDTFNQISEHPATQ